MSDEAARSGEFPFDQRIAEAVSMGVPLEAIAQHLSDSKDESHKLWYQQYKSLQTAERARERTGKPSESKLTSEQSMLQDAQKWASENPITTAAVATVAGFGGYALKERIKTNAEIRKEKELAKLAPSEAVQIQRDQLEFQKQKYADEQRALIDQETKNAIEQTRKQQLAATQNAPAPTSQMDFLKQRFPDLVAGQGQTIPGPTQMPSGMHEATWGGMQNQPPAGAAPGPIARNALPPASPLFSSSAKAPAPQLPPNMGQAIPPQFGPAGQPAGNIPPAPPMPGPAPSVTQAVATGGNVNQAIQQSVAQQIDQPQTLRTGTGREVIAGQGPVPQRFAKEYKSATDVPKGYAFLPGGQYIDVLRNDLGQGTYTEQFTNRPFPATDPEAREMAKTINRELNRPTRDQLKAQGIEPPEVTKGISRKVANKSLVKVGGVAGALIALSDLAKAENAQQRREAVGNALLGLLPPGLDAGGLNADEQQLIKERLAQAAYAQQVGGGRGVAPPSAYPQGGLDYNSPRKKK